MATGFSRELAATPANLSQLQDGDLSAPLLLPPGLIGQITGNIGGIFPPESFYNFNWGGGIFQTRANINGASAQDIFRFQLFETDNLVNPLSEYLLSSGNLFTDLINVTLAQPGNYTIGIKAAGPNDPQFTLDFYTPIGMNSAVPEPTAWAMMIIGLAAIGSMARSSRRRNAVGAAILMFSDAQ